MSFFKSILKKENLHHAYCIEGNFETIFPELTQFLEEDIDFKTIANPDFWHESFETFGIEESRKLKERQEKTAFGGRKMFIVSFSFITREAQNSLLKVFEEPTPYTYFFIVTPTAGVLLPTLRSRLVVLRYGKKDEELKDIKKFVEASVPERLTLVKSFIENKDKNGALEFISRLESHCSQKNVSKLPIQDIILFQEMTQYKKFIFSQGSSIKLILEHIALTFPR